MNNNNNNHSKMVEAEIWEGKFQGRVSYGTFGARDVLIISNETVEGPDVVPRKKGCLTQEDKDRLTSQGIPPDCWEDDSKLMEARYLREEKRYTLLSLPPQKVLIKSFVMKRIKEVMENTTKPGVVIHYIGPGKKGTGDWCFEDGFITFREMIDLYMDHFHDEQSKCLNITSDCSHSGYWVVSCREFLDEVGVKPCGHSAREMGILLKVKASCHPNEIAYSLHYSARARGNDKNTGALWYKKGCEIETDQHSSDLDTTAVTCGRTFDEECKYLSNFTYQRDYEGKRIFLVRGNDKGRPAWHYLLLVDDEETIRIFKEKTQGELKGKLNIDLTDFGQVLKSGFGEEPPKSVQDWITRTYYGVLPDD